MEWEKGKRGEKRIEEKISSKPRKEMLCKVLTRGIRFKK